MKLPNTGTLGEHPINSLGKESQWSLYLVQDVRVWDFTFQLPGNADVGLGGVEAGARCPHDFNTQRLQNIDLWGEKRRCSTTDPTWGW